MTEQQDTGGITGNEQQPPPEEQGTSDITNKPPRPSIDGITDIIIKGYEFARDVGGELFMLPGPGLKSQPYVPMSFLTSEVKFFVHDLWRAAAAVWNNWVFSTYPDEELRAKEKIKLVSKVPAASTVSSIVGALEAQAFRHGRRVNAELRSVQGDGYLVIDLGDATGKVVYVTAEGWWVLDPRELPGIKPPVFRRSIGYYPLPHPVYGGNLDDLWTIMRITDKEAIALGTGWAINAFFAKISRPGIWATGPPGSGKTTFAIGLGRLTDGLEWLRGKLDKNDERNNVIRAVKSYVPSFDNITSITAEQSDWLCHMVTGREDTFRKMTTNFDDVSMAYMRTFVATGLSLPYGLAADALERITEVQFGPITEVNRTGERLMKAEMEAARPRLLGALLDHVVAVLGKLPSIPEDKRSHYRMAEYADNLTAHDMAYSTNLYGVFMEAAKSVKEEKATGEPVVMAIERLFTPKRERCGNCASCKVYKGECEAVKLIVPSWCSCTNCTARIQPGQRRQSCTAITWKGTAQQLQDVLSNHRSFGGQVPAYWPEGPRELSHKITELDNILRSAGFSVGMKRSNGVRGITIVRGWQQLLQVKA